MDDSKIVELFWRRREEAIHELSDKYGGILSRVAVNILGDRRDAEECVNDAYLACWNSIPPESPQQLLSYVCRIVRNISISRHRKNTASKRKCTKYDKALDELEVCLASPDTVEGAVNEEALSKEINSFLERLDTETRVMFVRRYFYSDTISDIAKTTRMSNNAVSLKLFRAREKLREYLTERGYLG